ncbi:MAG: hypothetical protein ABIB98_02790 [bacterium]
MEQINEDKISLGENISEISKEDISNVPNILPVVEQKPKTQPFILFGIIAVLVLTIVTILVVLKYSSSITPINPVAEPESILPVLPLEEEGSDMQAEELKNMGNSVEVLDIQKDLENTSLDNIDQELTDLENLLQ